jgi:protein phosphatase
MAARRGHDRYQPARSARIVTPRTGMRWRFRNPSLVLLVGTTSSGKSTFARRHFAPTEVVSSDRCRALVADDENDQSATDDAFDVLHLLVERRLRRGLLTVVDATNVRPESRAPLVALARRAHLPVAAVVLDLAPEVAEARLHARTDRDAPAHVIWRQRDQLHRALGGLAAEGVCRVHVLRTPEAVDAAEVVRVPLPPDRRGEAGPFDVVGDVHGCADELEALLARLGYAPGAPDARGRRAVGAPRGAARRVRGRPRRPRAARARRAAPGDGRRGRGHRARRARQPRRQALARAPRHTVQRTHGLAETMQAVEGAGAAFAGRVRDFLGALPSHLVLDGGRLVVAHAGLAAHLHGRDDRHVRDRAMFGEDDRVARRLRAAGARGLAGALRGRGPGGVRAHAGARARWKGETVDLDTGCAFGGALTALRWPELVTVGEPARRAYAVPGRPLTADPFVPLGAAPA